MSDNLSLNVSEMIYNPASIQDKMMQLIENYTGKDIKIVDPSNPVLLALESSAALTAGWLETNEILNRKQYPFLALTEEELYLHMSDKDYIGRFATPSKTKFTIIMSYDELLSRLVLDPTIGIKKIIIPRNTEFRFSNIVFSMQYPVEIRQMNHGGLQIVYDTEEISPLKLLNTNLVEWELKRSIEGLFVFITVDTDQFEISSNKYNLSSSLSFETSIVTKDKYYYTRVYYENDYGVWVEIKTTHTDQIFDPRTPTALLTVFTDRVTVSIPQVYNYIVNKRIRVDVYQTKGPLNILLSEYGWDAFTAKWLTLNDKELNEFTTPLNLFNSIKIFSSETVYGGSDPVSFQTLRERVINNSVGLPTPPITPTQITAYLEKNGYQIIQNIDVVTKRGFLATKAMPPPDEYISPSLRGSNERLMHSGISASVGTLATSLNTIMYNGGVIDNGKRITLTSDVIYKNTNGKIYILENNEYNTLHSDTIENIVELSNNNDYRYSPFHYVLDTYDNLFETRAYYLDRPEVLTKVFKSENDSTLLNVTIKDYSISKNSTGYVIDILTQSGKNFKELEDYQIYVQMGYIPSGEVDRAYILGKLISTNSDKERVYRFTIDTRFDLDKDHNLYINNFSMYTNLERILPTKLITDFDIFFSTTAELGSQYKKAQLDYELGAFQLPNDIKAITHETLQVKFGSNLNSLWTNSRTTVLPENYETWEVDVLDTYEENVYQIDPVTGTIFTVNVGGDIEYVILHKKGDPVINVNTGEPVYKHRVGDIKLTSDNKPIVKNTRSLLRYIDLFLLEGCFKLSNDPLVVEYRQNVTKILSDWIIEDLEEINQLLLEQTVIYFYPKNTLDMLNVMIADGKYIQIKAEQSFNVELFVDKTVYSNSQLKIKLTEATIAVISEELKQHQLSISRLIDKLTHTYGNDVINVSINGLGGNLNLQALTIVDDSSRCSIKKKMSLLPSNIATINEDVSVTFIPHETSNPLATSSFTA